MILALALLPLQAFAQEATPVSQGDMPDLNAQLFRPSVDGTTTLWVDDTDVAPKAYTSARVLFNYAKQPLVYYPSVGDPQALVDNLLTANVLIGHTRGPVRIGLDVPLYLRSTGSLGGETGLGDIGVDLRGTLLNHDTKPLGLGLYGRLGLPTSTMDSALSYGGLSGELGLIVDKPIGEKLLLAANFGTRFQPEVVLENGTWNDQLYLRLGSSYSLTENAGLAAELVSQFTYADLGNGVTTPIEGLLGGWGRLGDSNLLLRGGVGTGLNGGIGAPKARVVFALAWEPPRKVKEVIIPDTDGDGFLDNVDGCPNEAEDKDNWKDEDGCPEPTQVTFRFVDQDGQPVTGLNLSVDGAAPTDTFPAGEHQLEAKGDGYKPLAAAFTVVEGAPMEVVQTVPYLTGTVKIEAVDAKGKRIPNATYIINDKLKGSMAEGVGETTVRVGTVKVAAEAPGYLRGSKQAQLTDGETITVMLELKPTKTEVKQAQIDLGGSVYFETNKDIIKSESYALLDDVAQIMREHPELKLVRIEGHTDSRGDDAFNLDLSQRRAEAVRTYLVNKGVDAKRLEAKGYGETRPLVQGENEKAWSKNRRVDFFIAERTDIPAPATAPAPAPAPQ